jgi:hypothetical protein
LIGANPAAARGGEPLQHLVQPVAARDLVEALAHQRVERDVHPLQPRVAERG